MHKHINSIDVFELGKKLTYAYFVSASEVFIGKTEDVNNIDNLIESSELQEIRFFNENEEYRAYRYNGIMQGLYISDEGIEEKYIIRKEFSIENNKKFGKNIKVCCYIDADDEGQNYISYSRLCGWNA